MTTRAPASRFRSALAACCLSAVGTLALAAPPVPPAREYARSPDIDSVTLSPSGNRLAILFSAKEGRNRLGVLDLPMKSPPRVIATFADADIKYFHWVNDQRLILRVTDYERGMEMRAGSDGYWAIDHDGKESRRLISNVAHFDETATRIKSRVLSYEWNLQTVVDDGSDDVWVYKRLFDSMGQPTGNLLARLDTRTGSLQQFPDALPNPHTWDWVFNKAGDPVVASTEWNNKRVFFLRASVKDPWRAVPNASQLDSWDVAPIGFDVENRLLVSARPDKNATALYELDAATGKLSDDPLVAVKGFDLAPSVAFDSKSRRALGLHFAADRPYSYWFDDELDKVQRTIDATLPGRFNRLSCGRCDSTRFIAVSSSSDRYPGEYLLYDRKERDLLSLGKAYASLAEEAQGRRTFHRFAARDGLEIPVYVTHPVNSKPDQPLPAVLLVHGGPFTRGSSLEWERDAQFLASRGYRVLQPEFRGSLGYGARLELAGRKQFGGGMQDDLADTVSWAAKQGLVDARRVCIMGASFGGYSALMSPIRYPETYRCAVAFAAVTDLELRYDNRYSDLTDQTAEHWLPEWMGDRVKDADLLRKSSPTLRASEFKVPVLLMHGADDRRVPVEHANKFASAAKAAGASVDYVVFKRQGHGMYNDEDREDYFKRIEAFLAKHLN